MSSWSSSSTFFRFFWARLSASLEVDSSSRETPSFLRETCARRCGRPSTSRSFLAELRPWSTPVRFSSSVAPALGALDLLDERTSA